MSEGYLTRLGRLTDITPDGGDVMSACGPQEGADNERDVDEEYVGGQGDQRDVPQSNL